MTTAPLLIQAIPHNELQDGKLTVPPQYVALLIKAGHIEQSLPPGTHRVVSWKDRLLGQPPAISLSLLYTGPVTVPLLQENLLTAQGEPVLLWGQLSFRLAQPQQFYQQGWQGAALSQPGQISQYLLGQIGPGLASLVAGHQQANAQVQQSLHNLLTAPAKSLGLQLEGVQHLTLQPAPPVGAARFAEALGRKLRQVELDAHLNQAEQAAQLHDVLRNLALDYNLPPETFLHLAPGKNLAQNSQIQAQALEMYAETQAQNHWQHLQEAVSPPASEAAPLTPRPPNLTPLSLQLKWASYAVMLLSLGLLLFSPSLVVVAGVLIAVGLFAFAFELERQHAHNLARWHSQHQLPQPFWGNLTETDAQVRAQLSQTLTQVAQSITSRREQLFQQGEKSAALKLKPLAQQAEALAQKVQQPHIGQPRYLSQAEPTAATLSQALDDDLALIQQAQTLREQASTADASSLQTQLAAFEAKFNTRGDILP